MSDRYIKCKNCGGEILAQYNTDICDECYKNGVKEAPKETKRQRINDILRGLDIQDAKSTNTKNNT